MDFKSNLPIYLQIVEFICDKIVTAEWVEQERVPSVRDLGILLQVNPNTVMRAYERLQNDNIINNRRGIGYFVSAGAKDQVVALLREEFLSQTLPEIYAKMKALGISREYLLDRLIAIEGK